MMKYTWKNDMIFFLNGSRFYANDFDAYVLMFLGLDLYARHKVKLLLGEDASLHHPFKGNSWVPVPRKGRLILLTKGLTTPT